MPPVIGGAEGQRPQSWGGRGPAPPIMGGAEGQRPQSSGGQAGAAARCHLTPVGMASTKEGTCRRVSARSGEAGARARLRGAGRWWPRGTWRRGSSRRRRRNGHRTRPSGSWCLSEGNKNTRTETTPLSLHGGVDSAAPGTPHPRECMPRGCHKAQSGPSPASFPFHFHEALSGFPSRTASTSRPARGRRYSAKWGDLNTALRRFGGPACD